MNDPNVDFGSFRSGKIDVGDMQKYNSINDPNQMLISTALLMQGDTLPMAALTPAERDSIVKVLFTVDDDDQKYREQLSEVEEKKPVDSMAVRGINVKMREADSINLIKVKAIVDKYSWLGADVIGDQCNTAMFMGPMGTQLGCGAV
jgi:hypothetical protein